MSVKLNVWKNNKHLSEIFQSLDVKFSFLTQQEAGEFTQILQPCKCRDFLLDVLWSKHTKKAASIYGMSYNYEKAPYDEDHLKLSLAFPDEESKTNFLANVPKFLHEKETRAGVECLTDILETEDKQTLIVVADQKWQAAPWKLSLYTYYLKLCGYADPNNPKRGSPEYGYKERLTAEKEEVYLSHVTDDFVAFFDNLDYNHNYGGFISTMKDPFKGGVGYPKHETHYHLFGGTK